MTDDETRVRALLAKLAEDMLTDPEYKAAMDDARVGFGVFKIMNDGAIKRIAPKDFFLAEQDAPDPKV